MTNEKILKKYGFVEEVNPLREYIDGKRKVSYQKPINKVEEITINDLLKRDDLKVISLDNKFMKPLKLQDIGGKSYFQDSEGHFININNITKVEKSKENKPQGFKNDIWDMYNVYIQHPSKMGEILAFRMMASK